jgi:hypothetical protein
MEQHSVNPESLGGTGREAAIVSVFVLVLKKPLLVFPATSTPLMNFWREANS